MRKIAIEWKHFDKGGKTCARCSATGANLADAISGLRDEFQPKGVEIELTEIKLPESRMDESNEIRIDGILLEKLLPKATAGRNECLSCGDLIGSDSCCCRTISQRGETFEEIPVALIREAIGSRLEAE
jgi:hypothetical protein